MATETANEPQRGFRRESWSECWFDAFLDAGVRSFLAADSFAFGLLAAAGLAGLSASFLATGGFLAGTAAFLPGSPLPAAGACGSTSGG